MPTVLRFAEMRDLPAVRILQKELFLHHKNTEPRLFKDDAPSFSDEYFASILQDPDYLVLLADSEESRAAGYLIAYVRRVRNHPVLADCDIFHVDDIFVSEALRGHGIGRALMEESIREAKARGCTLFDLGVYAFNQDAVDFYEAFGMKKQQYRMELWL